MVTDGPPGTCGLEAEGDKSRMAAVQVMPSELSCCQVASPCPSQVSVGLFWAALVRWLAEQSCSSCRMRGSQPGPRLQWHELG